MKCLYSTDDKRMSRFTDASIKCTCGHSVLFSGRKAICNWCGNYVYKNKQIEFEEKIKGEILSEKNKKEL